MRRRVTSDEVVGSGRLVVPLLGLPAVWADDGNHLALGAWSLLLVAGLVHLVILGYRRLLAGPAQLVDPTDMVTTQAGIRRVRFLVAVLILSQFLLDPSRLDVLGEGGGRLSLLLFSVGLLLGTNVLSARLPTTVMNRRTLSAVELALDTALVLLLTTLTGTSGIGWVLFALPIIEAAVRFRLVGALTHWLILTLATMTVRIWTAHLAPAADLLGDLESVLDQLSVLFLVVVPGAYMAEQLIGDVATQQTATGQALDRGQLLERVADAGREVSRLGGEHLDAIVAGARHLGFDRVDVVVSLDGAPWRHLAGDPVLLPRPGGSASGLRPQDLEHDVVLIDRHDADPTEVQSLVDHHLDAVLVQTLIDQDGRRVTLRGGVFVGTPLTAARADAFRLLAGQASVALRNDQLLSEITAIHEELEHQAGHDALTGLPNRVLLLRSITEELSLPDARPALLFLDLDGFKPVNDRLGHDVGDTLLRLVAMPAELGGSRRRPRYSNRR